MLNKLLSLNFVFLVINQINISVSIADYAELPLASGFDFPVGAPTGTGYYKARGFWPNGHVGEDWNGKGGGNTDLGDPVYSIGDGIVVQSRDVRRGWGNVIIIRHVFMDKNSNVKFMDSLYAHLDSRNVVLNQIVKRGQRIGAIGNNRSMEYALLNLYTEKARQNPPVPESDPPKPEYQCRKNTTEFWNENYGIGYVYAYLDKYYRADGEPQKPKR